MAKRLIQQQLDMGALTQKKKEEEKRKNHLIQPWLGMGANVLSNF
jgi:hypothetical protein